MTRTEKSTSDAGVPVPLVEALLAPPRASPMLVSRPRLLARLDEAALGPVTILAAEPAAGKTWLATDWIHSLEPDRPTAWLTVRSFLDDAITFWRYLLGALTPLKFEADDLALALADNEVPGDRWIIALANRLADVPGDPVIVVDDLHELESADVLDAVHALLDRVPANAHFVLISRSQPPWKLSGWRMSCRVAEIDTVDLRYAVEEGRELVASTGIDLDDDGMMLLLDRTEGWAGGLRLALLSMRHSSDPRAFVDRFAADDELVASYLLREVLDRQPVDVREFLLDVSILDELSPAACDALRSRDDSAELIDHCRTEHLFLTALPGPGETFHLHSLVAQLLKATLAHEDPDRLHRLHHRASIVSEEAGDVGAAIAHAVAAGDDKQVGELVSTHAAELAQQGRFDEIRSWLSVLRGDPSFHDPEVELALALTLGICGLTTDALAQVEHIEARGTTGRMAHAARQARAMALMLGGRLDELATVAEELDVEVPLGDEALPFDPDCAPALFGGVAALVTGDLDRARSELDVAVSLTARADVLYTDAWGFRARVAHADGELSGAERYADRCIRHNVEMGGGETSVLTCAYLALADVAWERDELDRAEEMVARAMRTTRPVVWEAVLVQLSASRLLASRGGIDAARAQLVESGQTYLRPDTSPSLRAMLSEGAIDLALRKGDLDDARRWERTFAGSSSRHVAPALQIRLAMARGSDDLAEIVDRALSAKQPLPDQIETLLAAASAVAQVDEPSAVELVARSTQLAEPHGMVRRFLDAGPRVANVLHTLAEGSPDTSSPPMASQFFLEQLAAASTAPPSVVRPKASSRGLVDPLTRRELQVLELLVDGQSYSEIGANLFVSRNTVKSHASHIYTKLAVSGRAAMAETAREHGLV